MFTAFFEYFSFYYKIKKFFVPVGFEYIMYSYVGNYIPGGFEKRRYVFRKNNIIDNFG